ncbi:MAG: ATP-binding protein [Polyangiales bacterium]
MERESVVPSDSTVALATTARSAVLVIDASGRILVAAGALDLVPTTGHPVGKNVADALSARGLMRRAAVRAVEEARRSRASAFRLSMEGRELEVSATPDAAGGGAILIVSDVTARRRREGERREIDRALRLIFRQMPGAVWTTDRDLRITRVSGRVSKDMNLDPSAVVGTKVHEVLGSRDPKDPALSAHLAALQGTRSTCRYRFRARTFEIVSEPLRDDAGTITGTISAAIDISESVEAAAKAEKMRRLLAEAQRVAHVGSWEWDVATNTVTWSDEMFRIYDLTPSTFGGTFEGFLSRVAPEDVALTKEAVFAAYRDPKPFTYDHRITRPDGSVRMLHTRAEVITDSAGKPARMLGSCWDTTESWETARALERSVSLLRATLEATADGTLVVDRNRRVTACNERFFELWSIPRELAARGDESEILAYVADQVENPEKFLRTVRELHDHPEREMLDTLSFRDGRVFERYTGPQRVGEEIVGRVWSHRDVTERERLLRRAEFLGDATRLLASLDIDSALSSVAHLAVPYIADSCAVDLVGENGPRRLVAVARDPEQSVIPKVSQEVFAGKASIFIEGAISRMCVPLPVRGYVTGALSFAAARGAHFTEGDLALAEELGRRAALALENARLFQSVQEALQARDEFLAIAAHEIRGPLASMRFAIHTLRSGKLGESGRNRALDVVDRGGRRLTQFVEELLDLGLSRTGRFQFVVEDVNLAHVVRDVIARNVDAITRSGSSLETRLSEEAIGRWDRGRIANVVESLLSNAIKFGLGKPVQIELGVENARARLVVRDHGIGISEEEQKRLFKPFERVVSVRNYGGLGLGLYIASTIVQAFGGTLTVSSTKGGGASFVVELPLVRPVT